MDATQIAQAAALLAAARQQHARIGPLPAACSPQTLAEAHAVQDAVTGLLGATVGAYKANAPAGSPPPVGNEIPGPGAEWVRGVIHGDLILASPARFPVQLAPQCGVEGEVAFRFLADLPPRATPYSRTEVAAVLEAGVALEVVTSRYAAPDTAPFLDKVADAISNGGLVHGGFTPAWQGLDLTRLRVTLSVNGKPLVERVGGHPIGDPLGIVVGLVEKQRGAGGMKAGQIVTTGSCTGCDYLKPGDHCAVVFEGLGQAELTFTA